MQLSACSMAHGGDGDQILLKLLWIFDTVACAKKNVRFAVFSRDSVACNCAE